jgi:hypothetical protein
MMYGVRILLVLTILPQLTLILQKYFLILLLPMMQIWQKHIM